MTLIKSISGIRGTIGGKVGDNLTPVDAVKFASAYGTFLKQGLDSSLHENDKLKVVIGRDARISGPMIHNLVVNTLIGLGIDVIDLGLSTTPTVEVAVPLEKADGGIILTASHNPKQWNALKLLNAKGEFLSGADGAKILEIAEAEAFDFSDVDSLGEVISNDAYMDIHIDEVLNLPLVDAETVAKRKFKVVVDGVNSSGGIIIPKLLEQMGVECVKLYCEPNGHFPHNPEPLKEHLGDICKMVVEEKADFGIVVDPDVDRLAFISNDGEMFGEEYTLVAIADYILSHNKGGNTVSNLSSTQALKIITEEHGGNYQASAVGEVNVVQTMKESNAVIGGEGNGGVIYPALHYGRDALVGLALFLSFMAECSKSSSAIRAKYPNFIIIKDKIQLTPEINTLELIEKLKEQYHRYPQNTVDGLKIFVDENWIHLRSSNTEPIIRIYTESVNQVTAENLAKKIKQDISEILKRG